MTTKNTKRPTNTKKIKDNIHGYIYHSDLETDFLSHPLVLRLHYVRQNGAAYLTYPSIRVHRYEHSIGAMHLAGDLFLRAVNFSPDSGIKQAILAVVQRICNDSFAEIRLRLEKANSIEFIKSDSLYHLHCLNDNLDDDENLAIILMYQAVRIAMLVHDIGHPPFSHTFEMGLKQLPDVDYKDHERVGLDLLTHITAELNRGQTNDRYTIAALISKIIRAIIDKKDEHHTLVQGIAEIVSGDVDADRLDYVRRDAISAGLSTNSYDVGRLFDAVKLSGARTGEKWAHSEGMRIEIEYHAAALSTLEAFFGMRFHMYRWMLWHHTVILHNMCLVVITRCLYQLRESSIKDVSDVCNEIIDIATNNDRRQEYWFFTDNYLMDKITFMYMRLKRESEKALRDHKNVEATRQFIVSCEAFLKRKKDIIRPFWKRPADYERFAGAVTGLEIGKGGSAHLNVSLKKRFEATVVRIRAEIEGGSLAKNADNGDYHSRRFCEEIERKIAGKLNSASGSVRAYYLSKFKPNPEGMKLRSDNTQYEIGVLSPSIPALGQAWDALPHLWLFWDRCSALAVDSGGHLTTPLADISLLSDVREKVAIAVKEFLEEQTA